MHEYTLNELAKLNSLELAMLVMDQQKLLIQCNSVLEQAIETLNKVKELAQ